MLPTTMRRSMLQLMLNGCTQDAADFALGALVHLHQAAEDFVAVYPSQFSLDNPGAPGEMPRSFPDVSAEAATA